MQRRLLSRGCVLVVVLLLLAAVTVHRRNPPLISIGDIRPSMVLSVIQVKGLVSDEVRRLPDGTTLFLLTDETGTLPVFADSASMEPLPGAGSWLSVTGRISMGADLRPSMRVMDRGLIRVLENPAPVAVLGQVIEVRPPPEGSRAPYRIGLKRPEGRIEVVHWFVPEGPLSIGDWIEATGLLGYYRGRIQLKVSRVADIRRQPDP